MAKYNKNDVKILQAIIAGQNARGANLPTDLDHPQYLWDPSGRLIEISMLLCNLSGHLSTAGLDALRHLNCSGNALTSLDTGKNPKLVWLECDYNRLESLDVSGCPELEELNCKNNRLKTLDLSSNPNLKRLYCDREKLLMISMDVSNHPISGRQEETANESEAEADYDM